VLLVAAAAAVPAAPTASSISLGGYSLLVTSLHSTQRINGNCSAIADSDSNLCLTASFSNLQNMTIIRAPCINSLGLVPDPTQAWQWSASENQHVVVATVLDQLVFIGTQATSVLAIGSTTNYVPTLVGTGVGAYVALEHDLGELDPADAATVPGLLISFTPTV
jgi:hypothetical protein